METVSMKMSGFVELEIALRELPDEVAAKLAEKALRKAGRNFMEVAKSKIHSVSKNLANSFGMAVNFRKDFANIKVGPSWKKKGSHAYLVEFGTSKHTITPSKGKKFLKFIPKGRTQYLSMFGEDYSKSYANEKAVGAVFVKSVEVQAKPHPFMRPAFDQTRSSNVTMIGNTLADGIKKKWSELASRLRKIEIISQ